jgi:hypothetical protein
VSETEGKFSVELFKEGGEGAGQEEIIDRHDNLTVARAIYRGRVNQYPGRLVMLCDRARVLARSDRPRNHALSQVDDASILPSMHDDPQPPSGSNKYASANASRTACAIVRTGGPLYRKHFRAALTLQGCGADNSAEMCSKAC